MNGKNFISIKVCVALALVVLCASQAFGAGGMVVSDFFSYSYYAKQLKEMYTQVEQLKTVATDVKKVYTEANKIQRTLTSTYNNATGTVNRLKKIQSRFKDNPPTLQGKFRKWSSIGGKTFDDAGSIVKYAIVDPRDTSIKYYEKLDEVFEFRQKTIENNVKEADESLKSVEKKYSEIQKMTEEIEKSKDLKNSVDLQNKMMAEMMSILTELLSLTANVATVDAIDKYEGFDEETAKKRQEALRRANAELGELRDKLSSFDKHLQKKLRIKDKSKITSDDIRNIISSDTPLENRS